MSSLLLRPNGAGDETGLTSQYPSSTYHWDKVDEAVADDATTYLFQSSAAQAFGRDLFALPNHTSEAGDIASVTIYGRLKYAYDGPGNNPKLAIKTHGTVYETSKTPTSSYANYSVEYTTNPFTGLAWTWAEVDALQIGVSIFGGSDYEFAYQSHCTQLYADVSYTAINAPTVTLSAASSVEETTATINGDITAVGGDDPEVTTYYGTTDGEQTPGGWDTASAPTSPAQPQGVEAFYEELTGLTKGELYYFSASATNEGGTSWPAASLKFLTKPDEPSGFTVTGGVVSGRISLAWAKGTGAQKTYTRGKVGSYPTSKTDGTLVYNNTGTSFNHDGLDDGEVWYYRAWSYATEGSLEQYSDAYAQGTATVYTSPETSFITGIILYKASDDSVVSEAPVTTNAISVTLGAYVSSTSDWQRLYVLAETGYTVTDVVVIPSGTNADKWQLAPDDGGDPGTPEDYGELLELGTIDDVTPVYFHVRAKGLDTEAPDSDVSVTLAISGNAS